MKLAHYIPIFFVLLLQCVSAKPAKTYVIGPQYKWMQSACTTLLSSYTYGYNDTSAQGSSSKKAKSKSQTKQLCTYPPSLGSMVLCLGDALGEESKAFEKSLNLLQESCLGTNKKKNMTIDDLKDAHKNATEYALDPPTDKKALKKTIFYQPVRVPTKSLKETTKYYSFLYFNLDKSSMLAGMTYCYFLVVFIFFGSSNLMKRLGLHTKFNNKFLNFYRANVSVPALFNGKHTEAPVKWKIFSTLIPTRMESIVIFLLLALNILLSTVHYSFEYSKSTWIEQFTGNVADRTGIMVCR
ncbi:Ferric reductase transmembrane component [Wickerhamomyces ciferrii]|uniref:Ferric reductase transmembrane component n=1 Tax=Wickerhamomyces ciferrii (strain ATCC 14091 / BCRC 22168 / CBS 111 / JCM 3599 / NBRC 0793 / NRRL Y-1031 F-60-10) TaxID=1206466 RepID=K0KGL4_WICCF|nr:Ferric reductase transmembrane component [Wickerhamomyces ciferrii]CCH41322.1 Ferric reductase transmembrane component [Wickerhamomyces ciferrii]